jgi:hypothetical protein
LTVNPSWAATKLTQAQSLATAMVEAVAGGGKTRRQRARRRLAAPEIAHGVAEFVVPLGPARREAADLIAAGTAIPWLSDQFHTG